MTLASATIEPDATRGKRVLLATTLLLSAALAAGATWVRTAQSRAIEPPIEPARAGAAPSVIRADGRVVAGRGGQVTVGAELFGTVEQVFVEEGAVVRAGDAIAAFRVPEQVAAVHEANAHAREAFASTQALEEETQRTKLLVESGSLPRQALSELVHQRDAARARRSAAYAAIARSTANAARARIVAPMTGTVIARKIEPGETVMPGTPLFVIADLTKLRVEAEVDEFDALRVRSAMRARVTIDGLEADALTGRVTDVGDVIAPRGIRPQDPARPLDAQVLKVKIAFDVSSLPVKLGQRVRVALSEGDGV